MPEVRKVMQVPRVVQESKVHRGHRDPSAPRGQRGHTAERELVDQKELSDHK